MLGSFLVDRDRYLCTEEAWIFDNNRYTFTQDEPCNPILIVNDPDYYMVELFDCEKEVQAQYPGKKYLVTAGNQTEGITNEEYESLCLELSKKGMRRVCTTLMVNDGPAFKEGLLHVTRMLSSPEECNDLNNVIVQVTANQYFRLQ